MKIDLVGPKQRGLAMGLNEFADTLGIVAAIAAVATLTFISGLIVAGAMYETLPHAQK